MPSQQRRTADALIAAFNTQNTNAIISLRTTDCVRHFLPSSLNITPQDNTRYLSELNALNQIFTSFKLTVNDVIEDAEQRKIVMFVSAFGETPVGDYNNEYVWRMTFDETGEKIAEWTEYVDAMMVKDFFPKLKAELKKKAEEAQKDQGGSGT